jgi:hypothetical protein
VNRDCRTLDTLRPVAGDASIIADRSHATHAGPQEAAPQRMIWVMTAVAALIVTLAGTGALIKLAPQTRGSAAAAMQPPAATDLASVTTPAGATAATATASGSTAATASEITDGTATSRRNLHKGKRRHVTSAATAVPEGTDVAVTAGPAPVATTRRTAGSTPPPPVNPAPASAPPSSAETKKATDVLLQALAEKPIGG